MVAAKEYRTSQADAVAKKRARERDISIPRRENARRRRRCEANIYTWLSTYLGPERNRFTNPFTDDQREMIEAILHRARYGGDQSIAAPRGGGKTTIAESVIMFAILTGLVRFPLIVAATGPDARRILDNIKFEFEHNELLAADYPEVCTPIRALEGAPQRGNMQTVNGERTLIEWSADVCVFPLVKKSKAAGAVFMTRGLDAAIRGIRYRGLRPDFVLIDDPETRESAASEYQTRIREQTIDRDIAGLGGPGRSIARVCLCTIQNRTCLAYRFTDRRDKPSWNGKRQSLIMSWPSEHAQGLWSEYVALRQEGMAAEDRDAREAHRFYVENRQAMDDEARVSDPYRYLKGLAEDGSHLEVSTLQHCYNFIADKGLPAFMAELQNDPEKDENVETSGISPQLVASRTNPLPRRTCPNEAVHITAFCDLGKYALHWAAAWWMPQAIGGIMDYGVIEVHGTSKSDDQETIERALLNALLRWRDSLMSEPFTSLDGEVRHIDLALVDSGDWPQAVYEFARSVGGMPFAASKGQGGTFRAGKDAVDRRIGDNWFIHHLPTERLWLYNLSADYWKRWCHERWLTPTFDENQRWRPGTLSLWAPGEEERRLHHAFSHHICAEEWREEFVRGKGVVAKWVQKNRNNHWLDCCYGLCAAASCLGVKAVGRPELVPKPAVAAVQKKTDPEKKPRKPSRFLNRPGGWLRGMR